MNIYKKTITSIIYILLATFADLISKYLFYNLEIANNIFYPIANHGISYSMLSGQTIYIIWITLVIFVVTTYIYQKNIITQLAYILVMSWWIWNLIDRIFYWYVRDFLYVWNRFPVFNLADILIFFWCIIIFFQIWNTTEEDITK